MFSVKNPSKHSKLVYKFIKNRFFVRDFSILSESSSNLIFPTGNPMNRGMNNRGINRGYDHSSIWNTSGHRGGPYGIGVGLMSTHHNNSYDTSMWYESYSEAAPTMNNPRQVNCGELREKDEGVIVEISGRVQSQQLGRFVTIKDSSGATQLVAQDENIVRRLEKIPVNANIVVMGRVKRRPQRQINEKISTGGIEVTILDILSVRRPSSQIQTPRPINKQIRQLSSAAGTKSEPVKLTSVELKKCVTPEIKDAFLQRSHRCGELGAEHVGLKVSLCGWICHSHFGKFIHLKDAHGTVQAVVPVHKADIGDFLKTCEMETVVELTGVVKYRPAGHESPAQSTGLIEVVIETLNLAKDHVIKEKPYESDETSETKSTLNLFTNRTHTCGELTDQDIGKEVRLCGWLRFERMKKFIVLSDAYGKTQCVIPEHQDKIVELISQTPLESILQVDGTVAARPPNIKTNLSSDTSSEQIEVCVTDLKVLNYAKKDLPFNLREEQKPKEDLRMQHRYLDLRFPEMQRNLRMRSKFLMKMREFLINKYDFVDVETPTLFRRTPGGAQEFIVPTQLPGKCYALTQSPQQLKQMLMVGGIDRYFQVARCYRDERGRADRQPEFTQLDIEMSFVDQEGIMKLIEKLISNVFEDYNIKYPFPRMTYNDAILNYGTDKPDISYGLKLEDFTEDFVQNSDNQVKEDNFGAFVMIGVRENVCKLNSAARSELTRSLFKGKNVKVSVGILNEQGELKGPAGVFTEKLQKVLKEKYQLEENDVVVLGIGERNIVIKRMGIARIEYKKFLDLINEKKLSKSFNFVWITDFPLFEGSPLTSVHHPFSRPHSEDIKLLDEDPLKVRSQAFDLVLNGYEVGGGSIRIHERELQTKILDMLNIDKSELDHLLNALECGCPPHGGIALGLDRLMSIFLKTQSIRDVIAFPKTLNGRDQLSNAPTPFLPEDIKTYQLGNLSTSTN